MRERQEGHHSFSGSGFIQEGSATIYSKGQIAEVSASVVKKGRKRERGGVTGWRGRGGWG